MPNAYPTLPLGQHITKGRKPLSLQEYTNAGGYRSLTRGLKMKPEDITTWVLQSGLRGRGGAGFSTGKKWKIMPMDENAPRPKYFIVNADEMEPGTFKDRWLMEGDPHQLIEGIILSSFAIGAEIAYIFLRAGYYTAEDRLRNALAEAYHAGYIGKNILGSGFDLDIYLHVSAGRYMCGEETGLLNALQGKRAVPRPKPPYPQFCGLFGKPTIVNNVETICNVPHIINNGVDWFKNISRSNEGGSKLYGVSGRVNRPGLWELPLGVTIREIFEDRAGGMKEGFRMRGIIPGGASTEFVLDKHLDTPMDFDSMPKTGSRLGTGTMIVLDDRTCPVAFVLQLERFFARESCGWCTPCREGLPWIVNILESIEAGTGTMEDLDILREQTRMLGPGRTFCMLAPGAMEPLQSALDYFMDDFQQHIKDQRCPWRHE
ncbi:MAG: NADH-quinone oxidoreductase subunit NuoF [Candidatus Omnitrophota bacterium]